MLHPTGEHTRPEASSPVGQTKSLVFTKVSELPEGLAVTITPSNPGVQGVPTDAPRFGRRAVSVPPPGEVMVSTSQMLPARVEHSVSRLTYSRLS